MQDLEGNTIIYLSDVLSPPAQAGRTGDAKTVGKEINNFSANFLLRGGRAKVIEPSQIRAERVKLGLEKPAIERSATTNVKPTNDGGGNKKSDPGETHTASAGGKS